MADKSKNIEGQITDCVSLGHVCNFDCCNQNTPDEPIRPESSILLYPGELEEISLERRRHITVTLNDFNGGKLGYCDPTALDQSTCDPRRNFKPLDCQSYPFAPTFKDGELTLLVDRRRCPLGLETLKVHHRSILEKWREVVQKNPDAKQWIEALSLGGYEEFNC